VWIRKNRIALKIAPAGNINAHKTDMKTYKPKSKFSVSMENALYFLSKYEGVIDFFSMMPLALFVPVFPINLALVLLQLICLLIVIKLNF
jgi:hypothetical protein